VANSRGFLAAALAHWPAKLLCLAAAVVLFFFYRYSSLEERVFSAPLRLEAAAGLAVATPYPGTVKITLRGQKGGIAAVLAEDLTVSGELARFTSEGEYRVPLKASRRGSATGVSPLFIRVEPGELRLTLEKEEVRSVRVLPGLKGQVLHGYELAQYSVSPATVQVSGPRSAIQSLERVATEAVDLTGVREDFSLTVPLLRDNPLLRYPRDNDVTFRGAVRAAVITQSYELVEVIGVDLAPELRIAEPLPRGSVTLQGEQLAVEAALPSALRLIVDCREVRRPGTYRFPLKPDVPPGLVVLSYAPQELVVSIVLNSKEANPQ
jgi:hypothetical protein